MSPYDENPVNPLPPVVIVLALALALPELVFQMGEAGLIGGNEAVGWRSQAIRQYAFLGSVLDQMIARGVPQEAVKMAEKRLVAINHAWDQIKQAAS